MILSGHCDVPVHTTFVFVIMGIPGTLAVCRTDRLAGRVGEGNTGQEVGVGGGSQTRESAAACSSLTLPERCG
jgi:hypothetical protein